MIGRVSPALFLALGCLAQEGGLPPGAPLLPLSALPDYERDLDHAGMILGWNPAEAVPLRRLPHEKPLATHGEEGEEPQ